MMQAVIIHGPQGCGKTRHAKDFCELYGYITAARDRKLSRARYQGEAA